MKKTLIASCLSGLLLAGCGGGGGGGGQLLLAPALPDSSGSSEQSSGAGNVTGEQDSQLNSSQGGSGDTEVTSTDEQAPAELPVAEVEASTELISDDSFDFKSSWEMVVDFDIADAGDGFGFLSICHEFEFDGDDAYTVNYDECSLRAPINSGVFNSLMDVTNDVTSVLAVIWFDDELTPPLFNEFELTNGQEQIVWR